MLCSIYRSLRADDRHCVGGLCFVFYIMASPYRTYQLQIHCASPTFAHPARFSLERWDCWETDRRDRTALFWAAGGGHVDACSALTEGDGALRPRDAGGDGSTPLHWAAAGVETRRFGTGGHVDVSEALAHEQPRCSSVRISAIVAS